MDEQRPMILNISQEDVNKFVEFKLATQDLSEAFDDFILAVRLATKRHPDLFKPLTEYDHG